MIRLLEKKNDIMTKSVLISVYIFFLNTDHKRSMDAIFFT